MLVRPPRASLGVRIVSLLGALVVGAAIVWLVLTFGYYASGLAEQKEAERLREATPIPARFENPTPDPNAP